jgi:hypothetical protein
MPNYVQCARSRCTTNVEIPEGAVLAHVRSALCVLHSHVGQPRVFIVTPERVKY